MGIIDGVRTSGPVKCETSGYALKEIVHSVA